VLDGRSLTHRAWLATPGEDPRPGLAAALLEACSGAKTILAYNAAFEKRCIAALAEHVPSLATRLKKLESRIEDLLPVVRDHVYHPDFLGSFSIKSVLPALVDGVGYDDLDVRDGMTASALLEDLLIHGTVPVAEQRDLHTKLLAYCERDTLAMVELFRRLRAISLRA
jgi:hypothetical protein